MWGGWYHSERIMAEIEKMKSVFESLKNNKTKSPLKPEVVLFIDEKAYLNNPRGSEYCHSVNRIRMAMGNTGIPYDLYMVEDAESIIRNYKTAIFTAPLPSEIGKKAVEICENSEIPYIATSTEKVGYTTDELREFLVSNGVHCYNSDGNVIYCGNGFLGVHAKIDGEFKITLPQVLKIKELHGSENVKTEANEIVIDMKKYETLLFKIG